MTEHKNDDARGASHSDAGLGTDSWTRYRTEGAHAAAQGTTRKANPYTSHIDRGQGRGRLSGRRMKVMADRHAAWDAGWLTAHQCEDNCSMFMAVCKHCGRDM